MNPVAQTQTRTARDPFLIRIALLVLVIATTSATLYLFQEIDAGACFLVPLGVGFLIWFAGSEVRRRQLSVVSFLVPILAVMGVFVICWLGDASVRMSQGRPRLEIMNQLKRIAVAMHDYHKKYDAFPPSIVRGPDGTALYSWRVALLPFLEEEELFARFHLDEPWDSPHNNLLLERAPYAYEPARFTVTPAPSQTFFQVFAGPGAAFEGDKGLTVADFSDGPANTFLIVEAREAVPWTKPVDLSFAPDQGLPLLGSPKRHRLGRLEYGVYAPSYFCAAMADQSVRSFPVDMATAKLRGRITRNGGEKLPED